MFLVLELEFEFDVLDDFKSPSPLFSSSPCQFLLESLKSLRVPALEEDGPGLVDDHHLVIVSLDNLADNLADFGNGHLI